MPMMPNKKLRPMVGQGTQGQMIGNKQAPPDLAAAAAQARAQAQSGQMAGAAIPAGMPKRDSVTTQIQDGLKNQLGGKPMGGGTHTMPDGTMMPNKAMPMPAPRPKPGYGGGKPMPVTGAGVPQEMLMPNKITPGMGKPRPMPRPMPGGMKPMKPKPVGPIGL